MNSSAMIFRSRFICTLPISIVPPRSPILNVSAFMLVTVPGFLVESTGENVALKNASLSSPKFVLAPGLGSLPLIKL